MTPELEQRLFKKYPELFARRCLPMSETCMCWGLSCGDGWYAILERLCSTITWFCTKTNTPVPQFEQVKEKFGTLRVYLRTGTSYVIDCLVRDAERESAYTCETCGEDGELNKKGWLRCSCPTHTPPLVKEENERFQTYRSFFYKTPWWYSRFLLLGTRLTYKFIRLIRKIRRK